MNTDTALEGEFTFGVLIFLLELAGGIIPFIADPILYGAAFAGELQKLYILLSVRALKSSANLSFLDAI